MNDFPECLNVSKKIFFKEYNNTRLLNKLRKKIFIHILTENENTYYSVDEFAINNKIHIDTVFIMIDKVIEELKPLGWKCKKAFGKTGLFIYSTEVPPPSYYPDGF